MTNAQRHAELVASMKAHGAPPASDDITHHFGGGVYAKEIRIRAGYVVMSHKHAHDHLSVLASGQARVITDEGERVYVGPAVLTIRAGMHHAVHALTDATWLCIHATDETDPERVDDALIERSPA